MMILERVLSASELKSTCSRWRVEVTFDYLAPIDIVVFRIDHDDFYAVDAICPHSGGPLYLGDIEDICSAKAVICPYHFYDFNIVSGKSTVAEEFEINTYKVFIDTDGDLCIEIPAECQNYKHSVNEINQLPCKESTKSIVDEIIYSKDRPKTLTEWAVDILNTADPREKASKTFEVSDLWNQGKIESIGCAVPPDEPPRTTLQVVPSGRTIKRGKGGTPESRIAILHALANIEQWAIDLAWDIIARFTNCPIDSELYKQFSTDFVKVARDEAKHFSYLCDRLEALGSFYGAYPIHAGLWESAQRTSHDLLARLAIVHMVHEARGLDVNPSTIAKFERAKDKESTSVLKIIHEDEITHVAAGHKWFDIVCTELYPQMDKIAHFQSIVRELFNGPLKPPFNAGDRAKAGLSEEWYMPLRTEVYYSSNKE